MTGRGAYRVTRCAVEADWSGTGNPGWARGKGVNDMYTQTGRTSRKEGKTPWKTKRSSGRWGREERVTEEGTRLKCLGSSDDSQSSCLLASRFPFPQRRPFASVPPLFPPPPFSPLFPLPPYYSLPPAPCLLFVAHASMRNKHCSKIVSPARAPPPHVSGPYSLYRILNDREFLPRER